MRGFALIYVLGAIVILSVLGFIAKSIYDAGGDAVRLEWNTAVSKQRESELKKGSDASSALEAKNEKQRIVYKTIEKSVDRYIDRPVYRNVCFDGDGLRDANAALVGEIAATGKPDERMPEANPAR